MRVSRFASFATLLACLAGGSPLVAAEDRVADWVVEQLQTSRTELGEEPLERRTALDRVAAERARTIAVLSHEDRLDYAVPIGDELRAADIQWFSRASVHLDMVRGYVRPEIGFLKSWQNYRTGWDQVMGGAFTSIGAATARGEDGWVIFVAVLLVDLEIPDPERLEQAVIAAVNRERSDRGLGELATDAGLAAVARGHSRDMVRRDFVDHVNPDGLGSGERVDLAGVRFLKLGENLHMNRGATNPVTFAVQGWLDSPGHRRTMLDPEFVETGVGVAMADDGRIFLTQLFMVPGQQP